MERLQKILAQRGVAARRQAEDLIRRGQVRVNGSLAQLGQKCNPQVDEITIRGQPLPPAPALFYYLLHKPLGVVSTCADPQGRPTVRDFLPPACPPLHPVGRLDCDSSGALLLTNDGELTLALTHPRHPVWKTYRVWVKGQPTAVDLSQWRRGMDLDGQPTLPAQVRILQKTAHQTLLEIHLREGRNRQIRRVAAQLGYPVLRLHRQAIGEIQLGALPLGHLRPLTPPEQAFCQAVRGHIVLN
ncbi:pseudouridine synthase [Gloeomargarita lithophora Alchichica-D10]|uniref:Pseudouridine synthase n=1 Tax=Gloeomargarita lithophora Alchichica-D10 TaxID=1188229 RepID=A0A1J0AH74_9CYAN|nr:pseudouridine synthase [Gloeomargarita lithophora]APB35271.1 pseudouridine synthase [Gloeomargarita lithophora Alchichica-D10]